MSVSAKPGRFGATVYNQLFAERGINAVYVPRKAPSSAQALLATLHTLDVRGCSVSMPLKSSVVPLLDELGPIAKETRSVNTIVRRDGRTIGYNADAAGAYDAIGDVPCTRTLVYGAGSVVRSVVHALNRRGATSITITARRPDAACALADELGVMSSVANDCDRFDLLVNATPASNDLPLDHELRALLERADHLFDLVVGPGETDLVALAVSRGVGVVRGVEMCKGQLAVQFHHYTGEHVSIEEIEACLDAYFLSSRASTQSAT